MTSQSKRSTLLFNQLKRNVWEMVNKGINIVISLCFIDRNHQEYFNFELIIIFNKSK